jgi:NADH-quinone oxidoreductase subunit N
MNNLSNLREIAATNDWAAILPELSLGVIALLLLALEVLAPKLKGRIPAIAIGLQILVLLGVAWQYCTTDVIPTRTLFAGFITQTGTTELMRLFFLFSGIVVSHLGIVYLKRNPLAKVEFFHLVLVVTGSFMLLVQSSHFAMLFVALETLTIGFYILVAYGRHSSFSLEAGLKYLVMGALSSGIMLFGIVLLYGAGSNPNLAMASADPLQFANLAAFIGGSTGDLVHAQSLLVLVGAGLVLAGVAFKIGLVPFQIWIPDVYMGAPTPTTAFLAVASKAGGVFVLLALVTGPFAELKQLTVPLLTVMTGATILFGNIAALPQRNVKRVMGLSGVAHAGILMLGVLSAIESPAVIPVILFYLFVYALASFGVFEVMAHVGPDADADQDVDYYSELMKKQPALGAVLAIGLGSLAGIPPLAGFVAKLLIFYAAMQAELYVLLGLAIFGVVLSIYYYFAWLRAALVKGLFLDEPCPEPRAPSLGTQAVIYSVSALSVILGLFQGFLNLG